MIFATNRHCFKRTHKFGIQVPKSVEKALEIDCATTTAFWMQAILKELKNVMFILDFLKEGEIRTYWLQMDTNQYGL